MKALWRHFRSAMHRIGLEIHRVTPASEPIEQIVAALKYFQSDLVLDIGANKGQFGRQIRRGGYKGKIVSFEPLTMAHARLSDAASGDPDWVVHPSCAVADFDGELKMNIAGNSVSSSVLEMTHAHASASPGSAYIDSESVPAVCLDSVAGTYLSESRSPFLKIDTQGFEWQVLQGARKSLPSIRAILCELSLVHLYEGQRLWDEVADFLREQRFSLWAVQPGFTDLKTGQTLQFDGIFFRS